MSKKKVKVGSWAAVRPGGLATGRGPQKKRGKNWSVAGSAKLTNKTENKTGRGFWVEDLREILDERKKSLRGSTRKGKSEQQKPVGLRARGFGEMGGIRGGAQKAPKT